VRVFCFKVMGERYMVEELKDTRIFVRTPSWLKEALDKEATRLGTTMSNLIRCEIEQLVVQQEGRRDDRAK